MTSDASLDSAFEWLCEQRRRWPDSADVWSFRRDWMVEKQQIRAELRAGRFTFGLQQRITRPDGEEVDLWSARDTLVLEALARVLEAHLPLSRRCTHLRGHGGAKAAVRDVRDHLAMNSFVLRTDLKSYYASVDHHVLLDRLARHVTDREILWLVAQYLRRSAERGGLIFEIERGLSLGCPLSPIMGAFFLAELDCRMERLGLFYVRSMDDVLVLAPTRWKLRQAIVIVNETLAELRLEKHPDKTFIGRAARGFDFLGYHIAPGRLTLARPTLERFLERVARLQEQERCGRSSRAAPGQYDRRWLRWTNAGLCCAGVEAAVARTVAPVERAGAQPNRG